MGRRKHCTDEQRFLIRKLVSEGKTYKFIQDLLCCSAKMIANALTWKESKRCRFSMEETKRLVETRIKYENLFNDELYNIRDSWRLVQKEAKLEYIDITNIISKWSSTKVKYKRLEAQKTIILEKDQENWEIFDIMKNYTKSMDIIESAVEILDENYRLQEEDQHFKSVFNRKSNCCFCQDSNETCLTKTESLNEKIEKCLNIRLDSSDSYLSVCESCKDLILKFYDFQQQCLFNYNEMKKLKVFDYVTPEITDIKPDLETVDMSHIFSNEDNENKASIKIEIIALDSSNNKPELIDTMDNESEGCTSEITDNNDLIDKIDKKQRKKESMTCDQCGKLFSCYSNLTSHLKVHTNQRDFKCNICERAFKFRSHLKKHMYIHTGERNYKCQYCDKSFATTCSRSAHEKSHVNDRRHECQICEKKFLTPYYLKKHMRIHTGEKPYQCDYCCKSFTCNWNRKTHMRTHTKEKPYQCSICLKDFSHKSTFNNHMKTHDNIDNASS